MVRIICALFAAAFLASGAAHAETYRLQYRAAMLGGVEMGEARYEITANDRRYAVRSTLRTSGAARIFDQTEITATSTGALSGSSVNWTRYDLSHAYAGKFRRVRLDQGSSGVSASIEPRYGNMGSPPASSAQQANSFDPLSALYVLGRQVGVARACEGNVLVFDGRGHYRLSVSPRSQGNYNGGGYSGPALSCNFRYQPISGFTLSAQEMSSIPSAEAWFALPSEPGFAPPLRLTVPTPIGAAQLELRGFEQLN